MLNPARVILFCSLLWTEVIFAGNNFPSAEAVAKSVLGAGVALKLTEGAAMFENPAMLAESSMAVGQTYIGIGASNYTVKSKSYPNGDDQPGYEAKGEGTTVPSLGIVYALNPKTKIGFGYYVTTGGTSNFEDVPEMGGSKTVHFITQAPLAVAYSIAPELSISLALNYITGIYETTNGGAAERSDTDNKFTPSFGLRLAIPEGGRIGIHYFAGASTTYKEVTDLDFITGTPDGKFDDLSFGTPSHISLAYAHPLTKDLEVTLEFEQIYWSAADHYQDLNWTDESLIILAGNYKINENFAVRGAFGSISGGMPEEKGVDGTEPATYQGRAVNRATIQAINAQSGAIFSTGYSLGGTYQVSPRLAFHIGYEVGQKEKRKQNSILPSVSGPVERNGALEMSATEAIFGVDFIL